MAGLLFALIFCLDSGAFGYSPSVEACPVSEVVFIDPSVRDAEIIVSQLPRGAEVVRLLPKVDGVAQISAHLTGKRNFSAVRIISHGNAGYFVLNGNIIDSAYLAENGKQISSWRNSLSEDADIMLYGCKVAESAEGKEFVDNFADLTGADIAASDDYTGISGDWDLEFQTGSIEATAITVEGFDFNLATYTVTSSADTGSETSTTGKLSWAITQSNASTSVDDDIAFNLTSGSTVTISGALPTITDTVTIDGNDGGTNVTVQVTNQATSDYRVFLINASEETVTIQNMTIKGGNISSDNNGGGIYCENTNLNLESVEVSGSTADYGGGIYCYANEAITMSVNINNCTFSGNSALSYAGAYFYSSHDSNSPTLNTTITNSTFSGNTATSDSGLGGGFGNFETGSGTANLTATNCTISGNSAVTDGGGVWCGGTTLTLGSCTIANNRSNVGNTTGEGGGVYLSSGILTVQNTIIANNYKGSAGTTANDYWWDDGALDDKQFNVVEAQGGGAYQFGSTNNLLDTDPDNLAASLSYAGGFTQVLAVTAAGNLTASANAGSTTETTDQRGYYRKTGTIYHGDNADAQTSYITRGAYQYYGVIARSNSVDDWTSGSNSYYTRIDGAANRETAGTIKLAGTAIYESEIDLEQDETITLQGTGQTSTYLQAAQTAGTGTNRVFHIISGTISLEDMTIRYGKTTGGSSGGGIAITNAVVNLDNCSINNNSSAKLGGGIYLYNAPAVATVTITNSIIFGNSAADNAGGGLYQDSGTLTLTNSTINNNISTTSAGGIFNNGGDLTITNSTINNNEATSGSGGYGGGFTNFDAGTTAITNTTFSGNSGVKEGGAIYIQTGTVEIANCTIANNSITDKGGGIYLANATLAVRNTIIANNTANSGDDYYESTSTTTDNGYNAVGVNNDSGSWNGTGTWLDTFGSGTFTQNVTSVDGTLSLSDSLAGNGGPTQTLALTNAASIANDAIPYSAGSNPFNDCPDLDQRGYYRAFAGSRDIGAYEYGGATPANGDYISTKTGNWSAWSTPRTWDTYNATTGIWGDPSTKPTSSNNVVIAANHTVTVDETDTVNAQTVSQGGNINCRS